MNTLTKQLKTVEEIKKGMIAYHGMSIDLREAHLIQDLDELESAIRNDEKKNTAHD